MSWADEWKDVTVGEAKRLNKRVVKHEQRNNSSELDEIIDRVLVILAIVALAMVFIMLIELMF